MRIQALAAPRRRTVSSLVDEHGVPSRSSSRVLCSAVETATRMLRGGAVATFAPGAGLPILLGAGLGYRAGSPLLGALGGLLLLPLLCGLAGALWGAMRHDPDQGDVTRREIQHGVRMLAVTSLPASQRVRLARDLVAMAERVYEPVRPILDALVQHPDGLEAAAEALMDELSEELTLKSVATLAVLTRVGQRSQTLERRVRPMAMAVMGQPDPFCFSRCLQEMRRSFLDSKGQPIPLALEALR
ncbi:MAG: hypothetical protein ACYCW6_28655 [Candidatus Xenobia bacterium]